MDVHSVDKVVNQQRVRAFPQNNYLAIYENRTVTRFCIRDDEDIVTPLPVPEFMDIKLTNACNGNCPYCYQDSTREGEHAPDPVARIAQYLDEKLDGGLARNLPFQVALGGGEPTLHPQFFEVCEFLAANLIIPNYTTNGLNLTPTVLKATEDYVGSAAVTCHPHLDDSWPRAFDTLESITLPALHVLVSDDSSIMRLYDIIEEYWQRAYYIVVLPMVSQGRAAGTSVEVDYNMLNVLVQHMLTKEQRAKLAWGAIAYPFVESHPLLSKELSLYEPEGFSLYLDLVTMKEYPSSFQVEELQCESIAE